MKNLLLLAFLVLSFSNAKASVLNCGGTEPFWGLEINEEAKTISYSQFSGDDNEAVVYKKLKKQQAPNDLTVSKYKAKKGLARKKSIEAIVTITDGTNRTFCSDGMSDFNYQYEIFLDVDGQILQGCCESRERPRLGGE